MFALRRLVLCALVWLAGAATLPAASTAETKAYRAAALSFRAGFWDRADRELGDFIQRYPASEFRAEAALLQAQARLELKDFAGASALLDAGRTNAGPLAADFRFWLAEAHYRKGDFKRAADLFAEFTRAFPAATNRLDAAIAEASAARRAEDWPRVSRVLQSPDGVFQSAAAAGNGPLVTRGWLLLAEALVAQEKFTEAGAALDRIATPGLDAQLAWQRDILRARALLGAQRGEDALALAEPLSRQFTNQPALTAEAVALQARILESLQRPDDALAAWRRNLTPGTPGAAQREALLRSARLLLAGNRLGEAATTMEQFTTTATNSAAAEIAWLTLAELRLRQFMAGETNALPGAQAAAREFLGRFPASALAGRAQLNLGWSLWLANDFAASAGAFATAARQLPAGLEQAEALFKLGDARAQLGDLAGAVTQYQAVAANPAGDPAVRTNLVERALYQVVRAAGEAGNSAAANAAMARLLEEFPNGALAERTLMSFGSAGRAASDPAAKRAVFADYLGRVPDSALRPAVELAIARTHELESDWPGAAAAYAQWLAAHTNTAARPRAEYFHALAVARTGDETNALAQFTAFLAHFPTNDLAPLAQWWVADHFWRAEDFINADRNYQLLFKNHPASPLAWEAQLMAGRAAVARQNFDAAIGYFTNLTSHPNCPTNVFAQALFAYGDTLVALGSIETNSAAANYREAIQRFSKLQSLQPDTPMAWLALGRIGDCYFQLGALDANAAAANYRLATNAYQQVAAATLADEAARSQAEVGLGLVLERQAALPGVTNAAPLLNRALDHYLNVVFASSDRTDPAWVRKAGVEALRLTEALGAWPQMVKLCDVLAEALPAERGWLERKKTRAEEQLRRNGD